MTEIKAKGTKFMSTIAKNRKINDVAIGGLCCTSKYIHMVDTQKTNPFMYSRHRSYALVTIENENLVLVE